MKKFENIVLDNNEVNSSSLWLKPEEDEYKLKGFINGSWKDIASSTITKKKDIVVGTIVLYNKDANLMEFVSPDKLAEHNPEIEEPIGIVVTPSSHDVYGTGEVGVMSLKGLNVNNPDSGSTSNSEIRWGLYGQEIDGIKEWECFPEIGFGVTLYSEVKASVSYALFPSDNPEFTTKIPGTDKKSGYRTPEDGSDAEPLAPSPYAEDGESKNPDFFTAEIGKNAFRDFNGKGNTATYLKYATYPSTWKTDSTLPSWGWTATTEGNTMWNPNIAPAVMGSWRYHTVGTNQGDWYIPSIGELAYLLARIHTIENSIALVEEWASIESIRPSTYGYTWNSTELVTPYKVNAGPLNGKALSHLCRASCVILGGGYVVANEDGWNRMAAIPFLKLSVDDNLNRFKELYSKYNELKDKIEEISNSGSEIDLSNYSTKSETLEAIQNVVGAAPEALDTLEEIAAKLNDNDDAVAAIVNTLGKKVDFNSLVSYLEDSRIVFKPHTAASDALYQCGSLYLEWNEDRDRFNGEGQVFVYNKAKALSSTSSHLITEEGLYKVINDLREELSSPEALSTTVENCLSDKIAPIQMITSGGATDNTNGLIDYDWLSKNANVFGGIPVLTKDNDNNPIIRTSQIALKEGNGVHIDKTESDITVSIDPTTIDYFEGNIAYIAHLEIGTSDEVKAHNEEQIPNTTDPFLVCIDYGVGTGRFIPGAGGSATITTSEGARVHYTLNADFSVTRDTEHFDHSDLFYDLGTINWSDISAGNSITLSINNAIEIQQFKKATNLAVRIHSDEFDDFEINAQQVSAGPNAKIFTSCDILNGNEDNWNYIKFTAAISSSTIQITVEPT